MKRKLLNEEKKRSNTNEEKATDFNWIELYFTFLYIVCVCVCEKNKTNLNL